MSKIQFVCTEVETDTVVYEPWKQFKYCDSCHRREQMSKIQFVCTEVETDTVVYEPWKQFKFCDSCHRREQMLKIQFVCTEVETDTVVYEPWKQFKFCDSCHRREQMSKIQFVCTEVETDTVVYEPWKQFKFCDSCHRREQMLKIQFVCTEVETDTVVYEPWKQFKYCDSSQKVCKLQDVCSVLREYADLHTVLHALLDLLNSNPEYTKEIILLINYIAAGGGANSMEIHSALVTTVVNVYIQPRLRDVPMAVSSATAMVEAQSNVIQVSLLAEGLGLFSLAVGGQNFSRSLLRCLYFLLECAGSPLHPLACAGTHQDLL
ncbi:TEL2-interacting protein 1 [Homalodisca vitripennis]|nr:TEL2-interacting protein 1 [Homalodisca vitripennis]